LLTSSPDMVPRRMLGHSGALGRAGVESAHALRVRSCPGKERVMASPARVSVPVDAQPPASLPTTQFYQEGMIAGALGALTIALWFLVVASLAGRPLWTPTVLGTALFRGGAGLDSPETLAVSLEMVLMFTWVHVLVFVGLGGIAARLLAYAERHPSSG